MIDRAGIRRIVEKHQSADCRSAECDNPDCVAVDDLVKALVLENDKLEAALQKRAEL